MTLTEFSYYSRRALPYVIVGCFILLILFYLVKLTLIYVGLSQPKVIYTNTIFNKIKRPLIANALSSSTFSFALDTIEGKPVTATDTAKVYFLPPAATRFGYSEKMYLMAKTLGFDTEVVKHSLNGKQATFADDKQTFTVDITNFNFSYSYNYDKDPSIFSNAIIPPEKAIHDQAINFLTAMGRYPEELAQGRANIIYLNYNSDNNTLFATQDPKSANVVEVDFYRPDLEGYPIVSAKYFNSQNHVIMVFSDATNYKILKSQVKFFEKSQEQVGVYPLISGDAAWKALNEGRGLIVTDTKGVKKITIKKMFLGYFDPDVYQEYMEPVYVFLGDNDFVAYVPAVANEFLSD